MARLAKYLLVLTTAIIFAGTIPQASAQVEIRIGHEHHYHRRYYHQRYSHHYYYRHGHRYYR